jgi:nitroreductase
MKYNLSEVEEIIKNRRSIPPEKFSTRKVHDEQIRHILSTAIWAPTHGLTQPWRFFIYSGNGMEGLRSKLLHLYREETPVEKFSLVKLEKLEKRLTSVNQLIVIGMARDQSEKIAEVDEVAAVACAIQNMALVATAYGMGTFWSTPSFIRSAAMLEFLGMQPIDQCLGLLYIGYPSGEWPDAGHRKPLEYVSKWVQE